MPSAPDIQRPLSDGRVLVTGASGLIGRQVLRRLGGHGDVVGVSRNPRDDGNGVRWLTADLAEPGVTAEVIGEVQPDVVIHLAGAVRGDRSVDAVGPTLRANLVATVELLETAARLGCRRIVLSGSLLEEPAGGAPDAVPSSPYGASRWAASAYGRMFHSLFGAPVVILRPSFAYGPGQEQTKLVPHVIAALLRGESPELSSGERLLDFVYSDDVGEAYVRAATAPPAVEGRTIDIGCGALVSVRDAVELIAGVVGPTGGRPVFGALPVRVYEQQVEVDVEDAAASLGWRSTTSLPDGLAATVAWFREHERGGGLIGAASPGGGHSLSG